ncbi:DUF899 family protein [Bacillus haimaensis]|uniref:DUF899 family protein n=1 Tax=Bacillus haimaensis TaxID=3160967 RepID=UPI003AA94E30
MSQTQVMSEIQKLELEIMEKKKQLAELRKGNKGEPVENYTFATSHNKPVTLLELFGDKEELLVVHNMGKSCSYCTMWADGFNGVYHHIIKKASFVVSSPDNTADQENFAAERNWIFPMVSTKENSFKEDMGFVLEGMNYPGVSVFTRNEKGKIFHHAKTFFGPGDDFCSVWSFFDLLPSGYEEYRPGKKINEQTPFQLTNNIAIQVQDYENARQFYEQTLGMQLIETNETETHFTLNGTNFYMEKSEDAKQMVFFEFAVEDVDSIKDLLLQLGCSITKKYNEKSLMIADPYGMNFHLFESK